MDAYVRHGFVDEADGSVRLACPPELEARAGEHRPTRQRRAEATSIFEQFLQAGYGRLGEITAPVLVAYGGNSVDRSGEWAPRIADALPQGRAERFQGAAHFAPFGQPQATPRSIEAWFG
jgi:pimeloyl-ACP methyl ester carboxylesterase